MNKETTSTIILEDAVIAENEKKNVFELLAKIKLIQKMIANSQSKFLSEIYVLKIACSLNKGIRIPLHEELVLDKYNNFETMERLVKDIENTDFTLKEINKFDESLNKFYEESVQEDPDFQTNFFNIYSILDNFVLSSLAKRVY